MKNFFAQPDFCSLHMGTLATQANGGAYLVGGGGGAYLIFTVSS